MTIESQYISEGELKLADGGFIVTEDIVFYSRLANRHITTPQGYFTDLASVPKIVPRFIVDVATGKNRLAAITHDPLCEIEGKQHYSISQALADLIFYEAMGVCKVANWRRVIMYLAVVAHQFRVHKFKYWSIP
jgi:hypothetical protein